MISFSAGAPFVLCEDAAGGTPARLFANPREVVRARTLADVGPALAALRAGLRAGYHAAGWLNYEAGLALEPRLAARKPALEAPLLWFGLFDGCTLLAAEDVAAALPDGAGAWLSPPRPRITRTQYDAAFARTQAYIRAGDVYQINLSYRADLTMLGDPCAAYARLRRAGRGSWSALVHEGGGRWLLSTSPELFFRLEGGTIEAKPMKGTARREADPARDAEAAARLRADPKERAENVMIVDLLRNDISKLAERGSVHVPELFTVETYPTLHTLTSTVRARLKPHHDAIDALMALFPCGSITGAPKIRAMEIIDELEGDSRGAYTGSIGWMAPDGAAAFNVAIRTIAVDGAEAQVGLGSAVVIDSTAQGEWEECRIKAGFISAGAPDFALIETMRFEPGAGVRLLERHLARLRRSARVFGFDFDEAHVRAALAAALAGAGETVARLTLARDGRAAVSLRPMPQALAQARVTLAPLPVAASDFRLRHKTTLRDFYDAARAEAGGDEVVFFDAEGFITEGAISNVFVERGGVLETPPAARGLLPGVLRAEFLAAGRAREADVRVEDLQDGFLIGNAVRGLTPARVALR